MTRPTRRILRPALVVTAALSALVLAGQALPAQAGDVSPPYFVFGDVVVTPEGELTSSVVAQRVDRPARTAYPLTSGSVANYAPSVSRDGRVLAFVRLDQSEGQSSIRLVITVDGRTVLRAKDPLSPMAVTPDGSAVTWVSQDGSVQAYRVATGEQVTLCDDCAANGTYASLSPDGRKLAVRVRSNDPDGGIVIRRLSDLRVLARTPSDLDPLDPSVTWRPDSRQVAYGDQRQTSAGLVFGIRTLTTGGRVGRTAFDAGSEPPVGGVVPVYVSPAWVNGTVWAIRLEFAAADKVRIVPVTAAGWKDTPVAGTPLRVVRSYTAVLAAIGSWATTRPVR